MSAAIPPRATSGPRVSPAIRFIEQFLSQGPSGRLTGLLLGQLDAFNRISTTFGHEQSSVFCEEYTETLRALVPPGSPLIRLSERRFAVLVSVDSMTSVMDVAATITEDHHPQMQVGEDTFLVDITLGIAVYPTHADEAASLFRRAELALKDARERELTFDIYRPDATQQQAALWKMESDLEQAVHNGELEVYYQPKVDIGAGAISGVEALIRWRTKSGRFVPAEEFIPLAERCGSIVPLTWLVFDRVRAVAKDWSKLQKPFSVAINISPQVLADLSFCANLRELKQALDGYDIALTLELTEDSLLQSEGEALGNLQRLRKLGIGLAIDDFGKGYSSLTYLKQIPATEIKIDKRFIATIALDEADRQIVKAVIELARALGMTIVAEGVDSQENLGVVQSLGCEMAQGYFIARPMRGDLVAEWIGSYDCGSALESAPVSAQDPRG